MDTLLEAKEVADAGLKQEADNEQLIELAKQLDKEIKEEDVVPKDHPERIKLEKLISWIRENGGTINAAKIKYHSETYRSVVATQDIQEGHLILDLPPNLYIEKDQGKQTEVGMQLRNRNLL